MLMQNFGGVNNVHYGQCERGEYQKIPTLSQTRYFEKSSQA